MDSIGIPTSVESHIHLHRDLHSPEYCAARSGTFRWDANTASSQAYKQFLVAFADRCHLIDDPVFEMLKFNPRDFRAREVEDYVIWDDKEIEEINESTWGSIVARIRDGQYQTVMFYKTWHYTPRSEEHLPGLRDSS